MNVINIGPLGFWMQLDIVPIASFAIQGFGGLFVEMSTIIKMQAIGQGIGTVLLTTFKDLLYICSDLGIGIDACWYLWNDGQYGMDQEVNLQFWVKASYYRHEETRQCLFKHFYPLPIDQFESLLALFAKYS
jgi:hypothetical protein